MTRRFILSAFAAMLGAALLLNGTYAYAHEEAQKKAAVVAVLGEFLGLNETDGTITITEQGTKKVITFLVTKDTVVSICRIEVCNIGRGLGAFEVLGPYEDIGFDQKGSIITIVTPVGLKSAISIDMHLKHTQMEFSPSDFISPF